MSLQEEIRAIISDSSMSKEEKRGKLLKIMTPQEVNTLLSEPVKKIALKEPLPQNVKGTRNLNLSVFNEIFDSILEGNHIECRVCNEYFKNRCTYVENGVRYLVPYDTITFYVGWGSRAKIAIVAVEDITYEDGFLYFHLGEILNVKK